ncbi:MAG: ATP-binding protein [Dehalococcoidia bacterium]|nr:ATP-binding protein [Dehalococcoidia bacterium]
MDTSSEDSSQFNSLHPNGTEDEADECPICKGAGFVHPLLDSGETDFSRVLPCQCQQPHLQQEKLHYLERYSNLGALSRFTFATLSPGGKGETTSRENFSRICQDAMSFASEPQGWIFLAGPAGCGKTHIACAIANYRLEMGHPVFYIGVSELLDHLRSAFSPSSELSYDELFERIRNAPLLVLDDLGVESTTPWAREKLEQLFNYRFNSNLPTVITSDVPPENQDERLRKYLSDNDFCQTYTILPTAEAKLEQSPLQLEMLKKMTFDNFDLKRMNLSSEQRQNLKAAFQLAEEFASHPEGWLIFQGLNGCGKTHLAASIANYQLAQGNPVFFIQVPDLLDHLRSTFGAESRISYDKFFEKIKTAPLLILDDFGQQSVTPWAQEKLYQLINYRYNAMLPTVVTMCASLDEIEVRCSSRMVDPRLSLVFNITAPDYRGDTKPVRKARQP